MSKVDELLQRLQKEQVVIAEEEDFTNFIMSAIPEKTTQTHSSRKHDYTHNNGCFICCCCAVSPLYRVNAKVGS